MRISDELTNRVLKHIENRNYQTNHLAKSLKTGKTFMIGLIVADISNPFFASIAREVELELSKHDRIMEKQNETYRSTPEPERAKHYVFQAEKVAALRTYDS